MGMGFQFEQHRLGLWDLSWDLKKNNFLGNGIRTPPPSRPSLKDGATTNNQTGKTVSDDDFQDILE